MGGLGSGRKESRADCWRGGGIPDDMWLNGGSNAG